MKFKQPKVKAKNSRNNFLYLVMGAIASVFLNSKNKRHQTSVLIYANLVDIDCEKQQTKNPHKQLINKHLLTEIFSQGQLS